jgi:hypothetical protein
MTTAFLAELLLLNGRGFGGLRLCPFGILHSRTRLALGIATGRRTGFGLTRQSIRVGPDGLLALLAAGRSRFGGG